MSGEPSAHRPGGRPSLLILSFTPIVSDARVLKQVALLRDDFDVTTCAYGDRPEGVVEHIRIPDDARASARNAVFVRARLRGLAYWTTEAVRWTNRALRGRSFDVVLANDYETVPIGRKVARIGLHADLHEYSTRQREEVAAWNRRIAPIVRWVVRRHVTRADSVTTVSEGLARQYEQEFGIRAELVRNAAPYVDAAPTPTGTPIRLVHSGAGLEARRLEDTIEAVTRSTAPVTLDLFLTCNTPAYVERLRLLAEGSGGRVTLHDPVPYAQLMDTLRAYDVGVFVLPPTNFNYRWAMPNKVFDYIQARLALLVGPSPEMGRFVTDLGVGIVTDDFDVEAIVAALDSLTPAAVDALKARSSAIAADVSAEQESTRWRLAIDRILSTSGGNP